MGKKFKDNIKKHFSKYYEKKIFCKAFQKYISFTRSGLDHLTKRTRNIKDVERRMILFGYVPKLIKVVTTYQEIREQYGIKFFAIEAVINYSNTTFEKIKIILREDGLGNLSFQSVMNSIIRINYEKRK